MPKSCAGFSPHSACLYSKTKIGEPAYSMRGKCLFCDPEKMTEACNTVRGRQNVTQALKAFRAQYETHSHVYNSALLRVPDEWRETFHAQALKTKRGKSKKPRKPASPEQCTKVAEDWRAALCSRKRAFADLSSEEVTAYKKRRKADRNRVEKNFFLDNDIPRGRRREERLRPSCCFFHGTRCLRGTVVQAWVLGHLQAVSFCAAAPHGAFGHPTRGAGGDHCQGLQAMPERELGAPAGGDPAPLAQAQPEAESRLAPPGHRRWSRQEVRQRVPAPHPDDRLHLV